MTYSLKYSYDSSSQSYSVTGYSSIITSDKVIIPDKYDDGTNGEHPVTSIGNSAFYNCSSLTSVTIPNSVTSISNSAFYNCSGLTSAIIGNGVTSIGNGAFYNCNSLTSVTIPDSVTSIGNSAFYNCSSLTNVTIPDSVTSIGGFAFNSCSGLTSAIIGNGVTSIGFNAFYNCSSLTQLILFPSTPPTLGSSAILSTVQSIYVQQSSKAAYQKATDWTTFASKIVGDNIYLSFVRFNQKNKEYIDDNVKESEQYVFDALNIQNGSGTKAIQQKQDGTTGTFDFTGKNPNATAFDPTLTGQIAYGATGDFAVSFCGKSAAQGERSVSAGTATIAKGKYSAAFGDNSVALGNESFVANSVTTASGQGASAFGNSTIASGYNSFAEGNSTVASGQVSHAAGTGTKATSNNQFVIGKYNDEDDNAIFIIGVGTDESNRINGFVVNKGGVAFSNNHQLATNEYVDNSTEFLKSSIKDGVITQTLNVGRSDNNNVVSQGASAAIGLGLNTNTYAQTVLGRYNKPDADAFFIVGNGTPENIRNAFEVLGDGRAKVQTAPKDNDDVVRKLELDTKQATLVSGTNIKTINGNSLLGSGDLVIAGGGTEVIPNPTLSGSEAALSALQIGDTKYRIEGTLTTLMVGIDSSLLGG